jgi:hypothetical protein
VHNLELCFLPQLSDPIEGYSKAWVLITLEDTNWGMCGACGNLSIP